MFVKKRDGGQEPVNLNKITNRIKLLTYIENIDDKQLNVDPDIVAQKVVSGLYDGVTTTELDNLAAETAAGMITIHPDYNKLAARIEVSALHKETSNSFSEKIYFLNKIGIISNKYKELVSEDLDTLIDYSRDYLMDYFGVKTLKRSYLLRDENNKIVERPQDMWMRVSSFIHSCDIESTKETYDLMSSKDFIHATPTLFNSGTIKPQLSSCFLIANKEDSLDGLMSTAHDVSRISSAAGGIGLHVHDVRADGAYIKGSGGRSKGLKPMLKTYNELAKWWDQGGQKRKGSFAIYLEPWHADVEFFLDIRLNHGAEENRARDLFTALWVPDLFMERVEKDEEWSLFSPDTAPGLSDVYGDDFKLLYEKYESENIAYRKIKARDLWDHIMRVQIETGTPYICYKDHVNRKNNQKNLGTIKSSNLCAEINEFSSKDEQAVCNLASIGLPMFVSGDTFNYDRLYNVSRIITRNLNKVIDLNYYPTPETKRSNLRHRPIGIGVQGLADVFALLKIPFDSNEAKKINRNIFETIYKGAIDESCEQAKKFGVYDTYNGSPLSEGKFQFDLWGVDRETLFLEWENTFKNVSKYGVRNSLLLAPMPTASTSQILGNNEAFEPFTSNIYTRRTLSGEFIVVNKHLINELIQSDLWNEKMKQRIIAGNGSIQHINEIPEDVRLRYRTVWEMSMKDVVNMAADRGAFVCQSQSMNIWMNNPSISKLTSFHFYAWKKGLKTGMYYLRSQAAASAIQFTVEKDIEPKACSIDNPDCEACGS